MSNETECDCETTSCECEEERRGPCNAINATGDSCLYKEGHDGPHCFK